MKCKKQGNQFGVTDFGRIIFDLDRLSMPGIPRANLFVGRVVLMSSHVTGDGVDDTIEGRKAILHSPESAPTEVGACQSLLGVFG